MKSWILTLTVTLFLISITGICSAAGVGDDPVCEYTASLPKCHMAVPQNFSTVGFLFWGDVHTYHLMVEDAEFIEAEKFLAEKRNTGNATEFKRILGVYVVEERLDGSRKVIRPDEAAEFWTFGDDVVSTQNLLLAGFLDWGDAQKYHQTLENKDFIKAEKFLAEKRNIGEATIFENHEGVYVEQRLYDDIKVRRRGETELWATSSDAVICPY